MKTVHYFANTNGIHFAAVAPSQYVETICFYDEDSYGTARIDLTKGAHAGTRFYEIVENGYLPCSYALYVEARIQALTTLVQFFGDAEEFTTPPARPLYVDRPNCQHMVNDLPF